MQLPLEERGEEAAQPARLAPAAAGALDGRLDVPLGAQHLVAGGRCDGASLELHEPQVRRPHQQRRSGAPKAVRHGGALSGIQRDGEPAARRVVGLGDTDLFLFMSARGRHCLIDECFLDYNLDLLTLIVDADDLTRSVLGKAMAKIQGNDFVKARSDTAKGKTIS